MTYSVHHDRNLSFADAVQKYAAWNESDHPRDRKGRFDNMKSEAASKASTLRSLADRMEKLKSADAIALWEKETGKEAHYRAAKTRLIGNLRAQAIRADKTASMEWVGPEPEEVIDKPTKEQLKTAGEKWDPIDPDTLEKPEGTDDYIKMLLAEDAEYDKQNKKTEAKLKTVDGMGLQVIKNPSGTYTFAGKVPDEVGYGDDATPEKIANGKQFGGRFGPKVLTFPTEAEAIAHANAKGYEARTPRKAAKQTEEQHRDTLEREYHIERGKDNRRKSDQPELFAAAVERYKAKAKKASGWITIGADSSQPEGEKGGSKVFVGGDGVITAGADKLVGHAPDKIGGPKEGDAVAGQGIDEPDKPDQKAENLKTFADAVAGIQGRTQGKDKAAKRKRGGTAGRVSTRFRNAMSDQGIEPTPENVRAVKSIMPDALEQANEVRTQFRGAMQNLFLTKNRKDPADVDKKLGQKISGLLRTIMKKDDHTTIKGWDEIAEAATAYPVLFALAGPAGEADGEGSPEDRLFQSFKKLNGKLMPLLVESDDVAMETAAQMIEQQGGIDNIKDDPVLTHPEYDTTETYLTNKANLMPKIEAERGASQGGYDGPVDEWGEPIEEDDDFDFGANAEEEEDSVPFAAMSFAEAVEFYAAQLSFDFGGSGTKPKRTKPTKKSQPTKTKSTKTTTQRSLWDESKVNRKQKGDSGGGQFTSGHGNSAGKGALGEDLDADEATKRRNFWASQADDAEEEKQDEPDDDDKEIKKGRETVADGDEELQEDEHPEIGTEEEKEEEAGQSDGGTFVEAEADEERNDDAGEEEVKDAEAIEEVADEITPDDGFGDFGTKLGGARKDTAEKLGPRRKQLLEMVKDESPTWRKRYVIGQDATSGKYFASDKKKKKYGGLISFGYGKPSDFDTEEEAEQMLKVYELARTHGVVPLSHASDSGEHEGEFAVIRRISDRKRPTIKAGFETKEEAMKWMVENADHVLQTQTRIDDRVHPVIDAIRREGDEQRSGQATKEDYDKFGLRGVEFGKWNNKDDRKALTNHAHDALADLSDAIDLPKEMIGLDGELGLGMGSRGHGLSGADAHYERTYGAINLTKMRGSGSLSHEWFHALDHALGRTSGKAIHERVTNKRGDEVFNASAAPQNDYVSHGHTWGVNRHEGYHPKVKEAFDNFMNTVLYKEQTTKMDATKADSHHQILRQHIDPQVDKLRDLFTKDHSDERYKPYRGKERNKPLPADKMKRVEELITQIKGGDYGKRREVKGTPAQERGAEKARSTWGGFTGRQETYEPLAELAEIYQDHRGKAAYKKKPNGGYDGPFSNVGYGLQRLESSKTELAKANAGDSKTKKVRTEFHNGGHKMDYGTVKDYWATPHELAARAFQGYVDDRLKEKGRSNNFLGSEKHNDHPEYATFNVKPFPEGDERKAINKAAHGLMQALKTHGLGTPPKDRPKRASYSNYSATFGQAVARYSATNHKQIKSGRLTSVR